MKTISLSNAVEVVEKTGMTYIGENLPPGLMYVKKQGENVRIQLRNGMNAFAFGRAANENGFYTLLSQWQGKDIVILYSGEPKLKQKYRCQICGFPEKGFVAAYLESDKSFFPENKKDVLVKILETYLEEEDIEAHNKN